MNKNNKSIYLDNRHLMSYKSGGYHIFIIIGGRGRGKTYSAKKYIFDKFFYKGQKFVWVKATEKMCDKLKELKGYKFCQDIVENKEYKFPFTVTIDGDNSIFVNRTTKDKDGKETTSSSHCGYLMPLSTFYSLKGNAFNDIDTIVVDEFIAEKNEVIRGDRAWQFLNTVETIGRLRTNYTIILLANALDASDPILNLFFNKIKDHGYYFNRAKDCVLWYMGDSESYSEKRAESIAGKLIKGTDYEQQIDNNKFITYDNLYFDKRGDSTFLCRLESGVNRINLYLGDYIYVTLAKKNKVKNCFVRTIEDKTDVSTVISPRFLDRLQLLYSNNSILFENETARRIFVDFIK